MISEQHTTMATTLYGPQEGYGRRSGPRPHVNKNPSYISESTKKTPG